MQSRSLPQQIDGMVQLAKTTDCNSVNLGSSPSSVSIVLIRGYGVNELACLASNQRVRV